MVELTPDDETLISIVESMLKSLYTWMSGESFIRCYLSLIYFHSECKEYLYSECFKKENPGNRSFVLLYFVDSYLTLFNHITFIAYKYSAIEV